MSAYEYASELQDVGDVSSSGYYPPHPANNLTQAVRANTYQNAPRIPGNTMGSEHRVKKVVKVWTCAKQHPTAALLALRPGTKFEESFTCQTKEGSAMIYKVTVDDIVYQGGGTKSGIAKGIAAYNALVGMKANGVQFVTQICDISKEEEAVTRRLVLFEQQQAEKEVKLQEKARRREENELMKQMKELKEEELQEEEECSDVNKKAKTTAGPVRVHNMYDQLKVKYGPDVETVYEQSLVGVNKVVTHQCTLKVQGFTFIAIANTKKGACALATGQAFESFADDPPPIVNERRRKVPGPFVPKEPIDFPDKLAAMCWSFVDTLIKDKHPDYIKRRNLVCIVKINGLSNEIEKCSVVAMGSGTLVIDLPNMTTDGTVINDCTGEALAVRAFRKYLLAQISAATNGSRTSSIFTRERAGKVTLKKDTKFILYTNSCPMGDARYFGLMKEAPTSTPEVEQMDVDESAKKAKYTIKEANLGKIQVFRTKPPQGSMTENPIWIDEHHNEQHCIKSPSDKLLLRNMTGFQGALISTLISPVYISDYYIQRAYNEEALKRGLYSRASGASKLAGPLPAVYQTTWKAKKRVDTANPYAFVWCEGEQLDILRTNIGKSTPQLRPVEGPISPNDLMKVLEMEATQSKPSPYCTANFYKSFVNVCQSQRKSVNTYLKTKQSAEKYNIIKKSVYNKLEIDGKGKWPDKSVKPNF